MTDITKESPSSISLERLVPGTLTDDDATGRETLELHMERYRFASKFVTGGRVLDCACGVGYGTAVLSETEGKPASVLGVDIDPKAAAYAAQNYGSENVSFRQGDGCLLKDDEGFDTIVSLETVEHVPDPTALLTNFSRLLRPGGKLIASVPVTPSVDVNPYHLHDFTKASFRKLGMELGLKEIDAMDQVQPFSPFKIVSGNEARLDDMRKNLIGYYISHPTAAFSRIKSTLIDGFCNKYLTVVWEK
ncbi:class I SAM-dependent methyltransferase [Parasphingorhabdus sp.]|uniref:class I SAM-dependent methyltransferase n=1 Tax=Parasphingorhabdus sp. TaxID=2709688 RepID=UPI003002EC9B